MTEVSINNIPKNKQEERAALAAHISEYLKNGGKITCLPYGAVSDKEFKFTI